MSAQFSGQSFWVPLATTDEISRTPVQIELAHQTFWVYRLPNRQVMVHGVFANSGAMNSALPTGFDDNFKSFAAIEQFGYIWAALGHSGYKKSAAKPIVLAGDMINPCAKWI